MQMSILSPQNGLEFPGHEGGGSVRQKRNKEMYEANWNFQRGWGGTS